MNAVLRRWISPGVLYSTALIVVGALCMVEFARIRLQTPAQLAARTRFEVHHEEALDQALLVILAVLLSCSGAALLSNRMRRVEGRGRGALFWLSLTLQALAFIAFTLLQHM